MSYEQWKKEALDRLIELQNKCQIEAGVKGRVASIELWYPRMDDGRPDTVEVGMCCVRAADSIQIKYDFQRDGWVIFQAKRFKWNMGENTDPEWTEVGFIQAWGSELPECELCEEYLKDGEEKICQLCKDARAVPNS